MTRWRTLVVLFFFAAPVLVLVGFGGWALWKSGQLLWLWFILPLGWAIAFLLARLWGERIVPLEPEALKEPRYWTPRDHKAWDLVEARMQNAGEIDQEEMTKLQFYVDVSRDLADEIARFYHPRATDPLISLTIPEILAAAQLALEDLAELYDRYVPGGHWLTVKNWRSLAKLPKRYKLISNLWTAGMALFSPLAAAGRLVASKAVYSPVGKAIEANLLAWFYTMFLQRVGFYLIEMNSGRLKGGKEKFREAFARFRAKEKPWDEPEVADRRPDVGEQMPEPDSTQQTTDHGQSTTGDITVCLAGQAGAGRSSLIRALLADADRPPETLKEAASVTAHRVRLTGDGGQLRLLDTPGYGAEESRSVRKDRFRAIAQSDLVLLVMNASSPARDADLDFLKAMAEWFDGQPQLKPPPVLAVLTHVDLLKPPLEWDPPYNWREPKHPKEESIHEAAEHLRQTFGERIVDVVPLCSDVERGRAFGVREWLEPAVVAQLEEASAVSSVRSLHEQLDSHKVSRVLEQVWNLGKAVRGK